MSQARLGVFPFVFAILLAALWEVSVADRTNSRIVMIAPGAAGCSWTAPGLAFTRTLRELGHGAEDTQLNLICFSDPKDASAVVRDALAQSPSLLVIWAYVGTVQLARDTAPSMPIVMVDVANPVRNGLIQSLGRPGGSITGIANSTEDLQAKRVQILKEALPDSRRLAVLVNPSNPLQVEYLARTEAAATTVGWSVKSYPVTTRSEFGAAFAQMKEDGIEALILAPDPWFYPSRNELVDLARRHRLPAMYNHASFPSLGGLFTYTADFAAMGNRAAQYASKILRGTSPHDLPVELPMTFEFVINGPAARELGLKLPPSLLLRATQVVE